MGLQSLLSEINTTKHSWKAAKANHSKMKTEREEAETILYDSEVYKNKTEAEEAERNAHGTYVRAKNNYTEWKKTWDESEHEDDLEQLEKIKELVEELHEGILFIKSMFDS